MHFFSDHFDTLPAGIVNKKICGVGITSFALENEIPTILCVPTTEMINNKVSQYPNIRRDEKVFGLYGNKTLKQLKTYLSTIKIPKILVTYDSLYKLKDFIEEFNPHIIIDEFSELLDCYSFRSKAINSLFETLTTYRDTHKISFISATPIKKEYLPKILQHYPITEIEWDSSVLNKVKVEPIETTKPINAALNIINKYRNNLVINSNQAFFFVNSVSLIKIILDKSELLPSQAHIICSDNSKNQQTLDYFDISTTEQLNNNPRKFNFITSTAFKGCDFYSETGIAYVISNNKNINTLLTIDTDIYQIAGRIRTASNPWRNYLVHIFNKNPLRLTKEESLKLIEEQKQRSLSIINVFNKASDEEKQDLLYMHRVSDIKGVYLHLTDTEIIYDELKELLERRIYETVIEVYQSGLSVIKAYREMESIELQNKNLQVQTLITKNFINIFREYYKNPNKFDKNELSKTYPLILEAEAKLGLGKCYALGFRKNKILKEISLLNNQTSLSKLLESQIPIGKFVSLADVKTILNRIYDDLNFNKKAKAKEIENYIQVKEAKITKEGKRIRGYMRVK